MLPLESVISTLASPFCTRAVESMPQADSCPTCETLISGASAPLVTIGMEGALSAAPRWGTVGDAVSPKQNGDFDPLAALAAAAEAATTVPPEPRLAGGGHPLLPVAPIEGLEPRTDELVADESIGHPCWGAQLRGDSIHCSAGFTGGTAHFKNKFCMACKAGTFHVPAGQALGVPVPVEQ